MKKNTFEQDLKILCDGLIDLFDRNTKKGSTSYLSKCPDSKNFYLISIGKYNNLKLPIVTGGDF